MSRMRQQRSGSVPPTSGSVGGFTSCAHAWNHPQGQRKADAWIGNERVSAERNDLERSEAGFDKKEWLRQILLGGHEPMQGWGEKSMSSPATRCALRKPLPATFRRLTYCSRRRRSDGGVHEYCCRIRTRHQSELCRDGEVIRTFLGCTHT